MSADQSQPQELTIVSWNMWCFNKNPNDALTFIKNLDFDILCLQEVPAKFLPQLETLPYHQTNAIDFLWVIDPHNKKKDTDVCHLVILSKFPLTNIVRYPVDPAPVQGLQYKFFRTMMHYLAGWAGPTLKREFLSAEVIMGLRAIQIFCIHPPVIRASVRAQEFAFVANHLSPNIEHIVCGDFNILDCWYIKPLNWLVGSSVKEAMPWYDERGKIEQQFKDASLKNPLRGLITHSVARSQLDHILVPIGTEVVEKKVCKETHGSDHNPVMLRVNL